MNLPKTKDGNIDIKKILIQSGLYLVLFAMLVLIIIKEPSFLSIRNFRNILTQSSVRAIIALGVADLLLQLVLTFLQVDKLDLLLLYQLHFYKLLQM